MDKPTYASILGTILGLAAGIGGMLLFSPQSSDTEELAKLQQRLTEATRERDEAIADRDNKQKALDGESGRLGQLEQANRDLADELARRDADAGDAEAAREWKDKYDKLKSEADEAKRQSDARIDKLEGLLEDNGILSHLSDEEIATRVAELETAFNTAFTGKDKKASMQALWDLQKLGPKAYDKAIEAWKKIAEDFGINPWGQGPGELGLTFQEYTSLITTFGMVEYGLTNPEVDPGYRIASLYNLPWWNSEDAGKRAELAGNALSKAQGYEAQAAIEALRDIADPSTARYLADYVTSNSDNPEARKAAVMALARKDSPAGWAAIEDAAANDPDPGVKEAAQAALNQKNVPVAGVLITQVIAEYQAALAGIKVGDILTHYNGVRVKTLEDINKAKQDVPAGQSVQVVLRRGEGDVTLTLGSGMIGINGVAVAPKE
ncbi:MAG: HEAT repeat domain-containing protein [Planctomycetes bacterium]|nr:HEAT repeat domain-containing protein [Planctomycetota bacterium]MCB9935596.1 HEAT repeat domain-containing protein [Planctomycetota bacterium]